MSAIQKYWLEQLEQTDEYARLRGHIVIALTVCKDGFHMSVQASGMHHCKPRGVLNDGCYTHWEVAYPSRVEETLMPFISSCDDDPIPTCSIYAFVPTEVIDAIIAKHGGLE